MTGLVLLIVALARPQIVEDKREVKQQGYDLMLSIDLSGSMLAEDYERDGERINRLQAIKPIIQAFIKQRTSDRIGMVVFSGRAYTLAPLTFDHDWLERQVERLKLGMIEDGTAIFLLAKPLSRRTMVLTKLAVAAAPVALPDAEVLDASDGAHSLAEYKGKWVVLNFWATWCAPCRKEMPSLQRLAVAMPEIAVVPVATGRNAVEQITKFYAEAGVTTLPVLRDPKAGLAHAMGIMGLPVTVILNPEGQEVARLIGDAEWDSAAAQAVLRALIAG